MGIKGLWKLLAPCGKIVTIESLTNKRLAVDASIWMIQFINGIRRHYTSNQSQVTQEDVYLHVCSSFLIPMLYRISRLLFHRIKPVFVFDGPASDLKRDTLAKRRRYRDQSDIRERAEKLLRIQLQQNLCNTKDEKEGGFLKTEKTEKRSEIFSIKHNSSDFTAFFDDCDQDQDDDKIILPPSNKIPSEMVVNLPLNIQLKILEQNKIEILEQRKKKEKEDEKNKNENTTSHYHFSNSQIESFLDICKIDKKIHNIKNNRNLDGTALSEDKDEERAKSIVMEPDKMYVLYQKKHNTNQNPKQKKQDLNLGLLYQRKEKKRRIQSNTNINTDRIWKCNKCDFPNLSILSHCGKCKVARAKLGLDIETESINNIQSHVTVPGMVNHIEKFEIFNENEKPLIIEETITQTQPSKEEIIFNENEKPLIIEETITQTQPSKEEIIFNENEKPLIIEETITQTQPSKEEEEIIFNPSKEEEEIIFNENSNSDTQPEEEEEEIFIETLSNNNNAKIEMTSDKMIEMASLLQDNNSQLFNDFDNVPWTDIAITEFKQLLTILGIPFIDAPSESEAQCACLEILGMVDGVITDDSDVFLFGAKKVYKNIFDKNKYINQYNMDDITKEIGLNRYSLIEMAMLLGSDYTEGIKGIGVVNALDIVLTFSEINRNYSGLCDFKLWAYSTDTDKSPRIPIEKDFFHLWDYHKALFKFVHQKDKIKWMVDIEFPDKKIIDAYMNPVVNSDITSILSKTKILDNKSNFTWKNIDIINLYEFFKEKFGWEKQRLDNIIDPVIRVQNDRFVQPRITQFIQVQKKAIFSSKRISNIIKKYKERNQIKI